MVFCLGFCFRVWGFTPETDLNHSLHVRSPFLRIAVWNKFSGANFWNFACQYNVGHYCLPVLCWPVACQCSVDVFLFCISLFFSSMSLGLGCCFFSAPPLHSGLRTPAPSSRPVRHACSFFTPLLRSAPVSLFFSFFFLSFVFFFLFFFRFFPMVVRAIFEAPKYVENRVYEASTLFSTKTL